MSRAALLRGIADLQARFGEALRTPLDASSGTYLPAVDRYDETVAARVRASRWGTARENLGVYNRQYWMRLFAAAQDLYPLTAKLLGLFELNGVVQEHLAAEPPREPDLARAIRGLSTFLARTDRSAHRDAHIEAARIDEAWAAVFFAPAVPAWKPTPDQAERLANARLIPSPTFALVEERWPLIELRRRLSSFSGERPIPLPPPLSRSRSWLIARASDGIIELPLDPTEARLMALLERHPLGHALATLEEETTDRDGLATTARNWLAKSVELGLWRGIEPADPGSP